MLQPYSIYGISILAAALLLLGWQKSSNYIYNGALKFAVYLQIPFLRTSPLEVLLVLGYIGINTVLMLPEITGLALSRSASRLALVNLVVAFWGGSTSVATRCFLPSRRQLGSIHQWAAAIATAQAATHGISLLRDHTNSHVLSGSLVAACFLAGLTMVISSVSRIGPIIVRLHQLLPVLTIASISWHLVDVSNPFPTLAWILLVLSLVLWLIVQLERLVSMALNRAKISKVESRGGLLRVTVRTRRPIEGRPGYLYIRFAGISLRHPFRGAAIPITWWAPSKKDLCEAVFFLPESAVSKKSRNMGQRDVEDKSLRGSLQGPFSEGLDLGRFETILLMAQGRGIAGLLPLALSLLERKDHDVWVKGVPNRDATTATSFYKNPFQLHNDKVRKVDLYWKLENETFDDAVIDYLESLRSLEKGNMRLQVWFCYPPGTKESKLPRRDGWSAFDGDFMIEISKALDKQSRRTPGGTLVITCGSRIFMDNIRSIVRHRMDSENQIRFEELSYATTIYCKE
ncbi:hypothetical protein F5Y10DRAFT_287461 [Nemania abortiva]|nr:hypothetical protein F5Y10DRAFT_287461 [Nemania abortiva]